MVCDSKSLQFSLLTLWWMREYGPGRSKGQAIVFKGHPAVIYLCQPGLQLPKLHLQLKR